jgi:hypothetical protein
MNSFIPEFITQIIDKLAIPRVGIGNRIGFFITAKVKIRQVKDVGCGCRIKSGACAWLFGFFRRRSPGTLRTVIVMEMDAT